MSRPRALIGLALVLTIVTRAWGLGTWSLDGDEYYTYWDVREVLAGGPWPDGVKGSPLVYLVTAALVRAFGSSELVLRIFPAACGIAAVFALALLRRDVVTRPAAAGAAVLASLSWWLVYHAQTARFYGPLFLFATLATLWILPGPGRRVPAALGAMLLAVATHPSALLWPAALVVPLAVGPTARPRRAWTLVGVALLGVLIAEALGAALLDNVLRAARHAGATYSAAHFVAGCGYSVGPGVGVLALLGAAAAWRRRHGEPDGATLLALAFVPFAILLAGALAGVSMHQRYAMVAMPAVLLLAGTAWARLAARGGVAFGAVTALALLAPLPELVSYTRDGDRHDVRALAGYLARIARPEEMIVAEERSTLAHYLGAHPGFAGVGGHEAPLDERKMRTVPGHRERPWIVLKTSRLSSYDPVFRAWIEDYFEEVARLGKARLPLTRHENVFVVYARKTRVPQDDVILRGEP